MKKLNLFCNLWLPVIFWAGLLFFLSSIPNLRVSSDATYDEVTRTLAHFVFYTGGYLLFFRALNWRRKRKDFWLPFFLTCVYGLSDEFHQTFVPTRTFQLMDLAVDFSGVFVGKIIAEELLPKLPEELLTKLSLV